MGRARTLTKIPSDDPVLNRVQDHLVQTLGPILKNPGVNLADWRLNEGPYPTASDPVNLFLQYRTPGTSTWTTLARFDSQGNLTPSTPAVAASYYRTTSQTIPQATFTAINFDTKEYETDNAFN